MNGIPTSYATSMLPLDARTSRIAARGGLAMHAHEFPTDGPMPQTGTPGPGSGQDDPTQGRTAHCVEALRARLHQPASPVEQPPNATIHHN